MQAVVLVISFRKELIELERAQRRFTLTLPGLEHCPIDAWAGIVFFGTEDCEGKQLKCIKL